MLCRIASAGGAHLVDAEWDNPVLRKALLYSSCIFKSNFKSKLPEEPAVSIGVTSLCQMPRYVLPKVGWGEAFGNPRGLWPLSALPPRCPPSLCPMAWKGRVLFSSQQPWVLGLLVFIILGLRRQQTSCQPFPLAGMSKPLTGQVWAHMACHQASPTRLCLCSAAGAEPCGGVTPHPSFLSLSRNLTHLNHDYKAPRKVIMWPPWGK